MAKCLIGEAAQRLEVSAASLRAWEREGKIPRAPRLARTNERQYSDELIEEIRAWKDRTVESDAPKPKRKKAAAAD